MHIQAEPLVLELSTPFRIAHGTSTTRNNVLVHVDSGVGVAAITPYYPAQVEDVVEYINASAVQEALAGEFDYLEDALDRLPPGPAPARAAVDMALHDLWGQKSGCPLYQLWGLNPARAPYSTYTVSMAEEAEFIERIQAAQQYPQLKLKLGTGDLDQDEALVRMARENTAAALCVDANAAWSVEQAQQIIPRLAEYNLMFIEQPLAQNDFAGWHVLSRQLPDGMPPLIADETIHDSRDILPLAGAADGINIKLAKCGGLREARRMITLARAVDMKVMLGCMVESTVGIAAAAHLAPLVDFADLDGNLTVLNDPYQGIGWDNGRLLVSDKPGLGIERK
ncbi:mandelate racemase/muconate lactonizing enzyme family protein [Chloroflexota bacterium]